ncbi:MAG: ATP phosphoribosyltransferase [Flavobacteriales bacterium]|nr:ATP phosphoribosyltransferase [Flavobacteriales bacterium]
MEKLKIAIQKKGRLSEKSLELFKDCGIKFSTGISSLKTESSNFPVELLFLRDDDIPQYVEKSVADIGILGENEVLEKNKNVKSIRKLGFASCRLSLAIPKEEEYTGITYFNNKKVATSYPHILEEYFKNNNINAELEEIGGSVEIAPSIGLADGICDLVSSGSTLLTNGLKEVEVVLKSQAVMIANPNLSEEKQEILEKLIFRLEAKKKSNEHKYIILNAPNDKLEDIIKVIPGMRSPSVFPLADGKWSSFHSVVKEDTFWEVIDELKEKGAEGILVLPIEKMIY